MTPHDFENCRVFISLHEHILARVDEAQRGATLDRQHWIRQAILDKLARDNRKDQTK